MMKYHSDLDEERDDATGGYNKYYLLFKDIAEDIQREEKQSIPHIVNHVDMDAILIGREKRLTIKESLHRGALLCLKFVKEDKLHQSDNQTVELKKEGFTQDETLEF